ncbi:MAG TPA: type II secretion system minor pseudopilin GspI [Steroidobacteraceae bacterium]|nr:type II secretion system minor pseudopilin GspI [Steroidobacteraceae bacterium]
MASKSNGFTLIEVLVALAVVAIGMAAVLEAMTSSANTAMYLQSKTFAEWVALNRIETVRLSGNVPTAGTSNDTTDYAGQSWEWRQKVADTPVAGVVRIDVDVRPADSKAGDDRGWYATATGFMGKAVQTSPILLEPAWSTQPIVGLPPNSNPNSNASSATP